MTPSPTPSEGEVCADCGLERREHHHDGAAYGVCGQFSEVSHTKPSEGEAMRWQCPQCGYSVTPNEILSVRKHFSAHALECVRCLYRTETKGTWDEAIAAYRRAAAQSSSMVREDCAKVVERNGCGECDNHKIVAAKIRALSPDTPREGEK